MSRSVPIIRTPSGVRGSTATIAAHNSGRKCRQAAKNHSPTHTLRGHFFPVRARCLRFSSETSLWDTDRTSPWQWRRRTGTHSADCPLSADASATKLQRAILTSSICAMTGMSSRAPTTSSGTRRTRTFNGLKALCRKSRISFFARTKIRLILKRATRCRTDAHTSSPYGRHRKSISIRKPSFRTRTNRCNPALPEMLRKPAGH